jgi:acylglycerol lipase
MYYEDKHSKFVKEEDVGKIKTKDGLDLYWRKWIPNEWKATLMLVHGIMDHTDIYDYLAEIFAENGFATYGFDMRGFGRSDGQRGYVETYVDWINDINFFFTKKVQPESKDKPIFILSFSMGSAIGMNYVRSYPEGLKGAIFTETGNRFSKGIQFSTTLSSYMKDSLKKSSVKMFTLPSFLRDTNDITEKVFKSPYTLKEVTASLGTEISKALRIIQRRLNRIKIPVLIQYGSNDGVFEGQDELFMEFGSEDKTIKEYKGLGHDIFKEDEMYRKVPIADLIDWVNNHI